MKIRSLKHVLLVVALGSLSFAAQAQVSLLNVSYDVARDVFKDYNPKFIAAWKAKTGETVEVKQSHAGSTGQVRAVADGLEADVVTMNQATDINFLVTKGLVAPDWTKKFPNDAAPYTSTMVFIVRKGNPKALKDWSDLAKPGVAVIIPHPKNTGNGRYSYLAAWGWALHQPGGNEKTAATFVGQLLKNAPLFPSGGRDATTTFMQRGQGDVLLTFESEAELIAKEFGRGNFEVVYPTESILTELPVAIVEKNVDKHGTRKQAQAYLEYLWSKEGQENAAQNYIRPRDAEIAKKYAAQFPPIKTFTVNETFGGWEKATAAHFKDGGSFDQIYQTK
ncbi:sulfate ABC transporter substrate-binding protein [Uliginosibacterium sp. H3]|uniref:Sulfate ABC transporter substrate-binding protein n=1 Tax=Uliginosibacterium silvisoli TaxID=3114758 RepID=A0ABU6K3T8_9RHOO|nr:sulfate ABC transporter substrate-binding protein [Uliginosibacterium sp. H3]